MTLAIANKVKTISSLELVTIINEVRAKEGKTTTLRHDNLIKKNEVHPGIDSRIFLGEYTDSIGRSLKCYHLPKREAELIAMSESLTIQAKVYDRLNEMYRIAETKKSAKYVPSASLAMLREAQARKSNVEAAASILTKVFNIPDCVRMNLLNERSEIEIFCRRSY